MIGPRNHHFSGLDRLAKTIQNRWLKLRQFVKKQNAMMGKGYFPRPCTKSAADKGSH